MLYTLIEYALPTNDSARYIRTLLLKNYYYKTLSRTGKWFTPSAMSVLASELQAIILHTFWLDFYWKLHFFQMLVTKGTKNPLNRTFLKFIAKLFFLFLDRKGISKQKQKKNRFF